MSTTISAMTPVPTQAAVSTKTPLKTVKSAADITARYARQALKNITESPLLNNANQYGTLLARGAERQIATSATVHGAGAMGFTALAATLWELTKGLSFTIGEAAKNLKIDALSSSFAGVSLGGFAAGVSGLSALYCLDQLCDTVFGKSVLKTVVGGALKRSQTESSGK